MRHQIAFIPLDERYVREWTVSQNRQRYASDVHDFITRDGQHAFAVTWECGDVTVWDVVIHGRMPWPRPEHHDVVALYG